MNNNIKAEAITIITTTITRINNQISTLSIDEFKDNLLKLRH